MWRLNVRRRNAAWMLVRHHRILLAVFIACGVGLADRLVVSPPHRSHTYGVAQSTCLSWQVQLTFAHHNATECIDWNALEYAESAVDGRATYIYPPIDPRGTPWIRSAPSAAGAAAVPTTSASYTAADVLRSLAARPVFQLAQPSEPAAGQVRVHVFTHACRHKHSPCKVGTGQPVLPA